MFLYFTNGYQPATFCKIHYILIFSQDETTSDEIHSQDELYIMYWLNEMSFYDNYLLI